MAALSRLAFRSSRNYWAAVASEALAPVLRGWAKTKTRQPIQAKENWRKLLLVGANHIGDILYRTSALEALSDGLPNCELHIVAPYPASEVLVGSPHIAKIHDFPLPRGRHDQGFESLLKEGYDAAICYDSGMYVRPLRLLVELGIPYRIAYVHKGFSGWVTQGVPITYPQPYAHYFRDLVEQVVGLKLEGTSNPRIYPSPEDEEVAGAFWRKEGLDRRRRVLAIFCTSRQPAALWPAEYFRELVRMICADESVAVVLSGAAADRAQLESMVGDKRGQAIVCAGDLNLRQMSVLLTLCHGVLAPDSGSRHIADAAGRPVFFFRNLQSEEVETGTYCPNEEDLCPGGSYLSLEEQQNVLRNIAPGEVYRKMSRLLES